mmetsp:Transcript_8715/g.21969  ORF Transcript_8715/g.21969 Transcript_8715/m.21969 type:complete len:647 (-) Transcript_8715:24-1964(-)
MLFQVATLQTQLHTEQGRVSLLTEQQEARQQEMDQLSKQFSEEKLEWQNSSASYDQQIATLNQLEATTRFELEAQLQRAEALTTELEKLRDSERSYEEQLVNMKKDYEQMKQVHTDLQTECEDGANTLAQLKELHAEQVAELTQAVEELRSQLANESESESAAISALRDEHKRALESLQSKLQEVATEKEALSVKLLAWDSTQKNLEIQLQETKDSHRSELARMEQSLEKMQQRAIDKDMQATGLLMKLNQTTSDMEEGKKQLDAVQLQLDAAKQECTASADAKQRLEDQLSVLASEKEALLESARLADTKLQDLEEQLAQASQERDSFSQSLKEAESNVKSSQATLQRDHERRVQSLQESLDKETLAHTATRTRLMEVENILEVTRNASHRSENLEEVIHERDSAREVLQQKEKELEQLTNMLNTNDEIVCKLKEKFLALQRTTGGQTVEKLKAELTNCKHLNEQLKSKIKKYHARASKSDLLSKKVVEKSAEIDELRKQLAALRSAPAVTASPSLRRLSGSGRRDSSSFRSPVGTRATPTSRRPARITPSRDAAIDTAMLRRHTSASGAKRPGSPLPKLAAATITPAGSENTAPNPSPAARRSTRNGSSIRKTVSDETPIASRSAALLSRIQQNLERCETSTRK